MASLDYRTSTILNSYAQGDTAPLSVEWRRLFQTALEAGSGRGMQWSNLVLGRPAAHRADALQLTERFIKNHVISRS
jgi:hypothetical protein